MRNRGEEERERDYEREREKERERKEREREREREGERGRERFTEHFLSIGLKIHGNSYRYSWSIKPLRLVDHELTI